ncbi:MAG: hypothetical protein KC621_01215, partial [Myxococcales bacterium]|nr:hypothetical protein [Myxococcales bacterium]
VPEPPPVEPPPVDPPVEPAPTVPEEPPPLEPEPVAVAPEPTPEPASVRPPREPRSEPRPPREPRPARPSRAPVTGVAPVTLAIGPSARPGMNASAWVGVGFRPVDTGVATLDLELGWVPERWIPVPQSIQFRTMDTADLEVRLGLRPLPMGLVYAGGAVSHRTFHQQGQRIATRVRPLVVTGVEVDPMRSWRIAPVLRVGVGYDLVPTMVVSETGHSRTLTSFQLVSTLGVRVTPTTLFGKTEKRARL